MKLERRLARLEATIDQLQEKRQYLLADHLALRASLLAIIPLISTSSSAQYEQAKSGAMNQLATELTLLKFQKETIAESLEGITEFFAALDDAIADLDQPPPVLS